ncbi:hypothetical protein F2Q69_00038116 [Brassica cretica]|uniref:Uncharacterized protein n=1 Tax=Brassica cretica TaxID=69181 RepID=A0A8S9SMF2_BRACR|nr:hypothetical protein F2Q69_00038116 [Brassica cretica]
MDNANLLTTVDAEGGLPNLPRLRFNKEGNLLAVTTADNGFKILTNADGLRTLGAYEVLARVSMLVVQVPTSAMVSSMSPASIGKVEHMDSDSPARPTPFHNGIEAMSRTMEKPRNLESID